MCGEVASKIPTNLKGVQIWWSSCVNFVCPHQFESCKKYIHNFTYITYYINIYWSAELAYIEALFSDNLISMSAIDIEDADYVCTLDAATIEKAKKELNEDPKERLLAVKAFRDWIKQQPHLTSPTGIKWYEFKYYIKIIVDFSMSL